MRAWKGEFSKVFWKYQCLWVPEDWTDVLMYIMHLFSSSLLLLLLKTLIILYYVDLWARCQLCSISFLERNKWHLKCWVVPVTSGRGNAVTKPLQETCGFWAPDACDLADEDVWSTPHISYLSALINIIIIEQEFMYTMSYQHHNYECSE